MLRTITAAELVKALENVAPDARVVFASNYGDRCRTRQAHAIRGRIEETALKESDYSDSGYALADEDDGGGDGDETFVVIR